MASRFSREDLAYDYVIDHGADSPLGVMFARDRDLAQWSGSHEAAIEGQSLRYHESQVVWKNAGVGAGHSRRTPATTGRTVEGAILSGGISYGEWITSKVPDILMPAGELTELRVDASMISTARIHTARDFDGDVYLSTGQQAVLVVRNGTDTVADVAYWGGDSYTAYEVEVFGNALWVTGGANPMAKNDGTSWTQSEAAVTRRKMAVVNWSVGGSLSTGGAATYNGVPVNFLVSCDPDLHSMYHVAEETDPKVAANWSSATAIVRSPYLINEIVADNHTVWFAANNGLHAVNELGYAPNLTEWVKRHYLPENGEQSIIQDGLIWYAHAAGLAVVPADDSRQDFAQWAQFGHLTPNQTPIYGRPQVLAPGGDCLWVGYYAEQSDTSYLFQLLVERGDGALRLRWSGPEAVFPGEGFDLVQRISPATGAPYLLIATRNFTTSVTRLYKQSLPVSGNPYVDWVNQTGHRFSPRWTVYLPRDDFDATSPKTLRRYDVVAENLGDGNTVVIEASADSGAYVQQGTATLSPRSTTVPSDDYVSGVNFNWKLTGTNTATEPIVLEAFSARGSVLVETSDVQTFPVLLAWSQTLLNGQDEQRDPYADWRRLRSYQRRGPIQALDTFGVVKTVKVEHVGPYRVAWDQRREEWVMVAPVTISTLQEPALYDSGFGYDSGETYVGSA